MLKSYNAIQPILPEEITFVHSEELEERYPEMTPKEREYQACKEHGAVFVIGIGSALKNGQPHKRRLPLCAVYRKANIEWQFKKSFRFIERLTCGLRAVLRERLPQFVNRKSSLIFPIS